MLYLNMQCLHVQELLQFIFIFQICKQISLKFCDIKEMEYYHSNWLSDFNSTAMKREFGTPDAVNPLESKIIFLGVEIVGVIVSGKSIFELQMPFPS